MMIEAKCSVTGYSDLLSNSSGLDDSVPESFSVYLAEETAAIENVAEDTDTDEDTEYNQDIVAIKEKGLVAFIIEQREKRIREEILASMGLTEESLAEMPPEQRTRIEKRIAEETQKRMAAEALMQNNKDKRQDTTKLLKTVTMGSGTDSIFKIK